jgi:hypothetical protein
MRTGCPVLAIKWNEAQLTFDDPTAPSGDHGSRQHAHTSCKRGGWQDRSGGSPPCLAGTGWLVAPETIVTNRHVAAEFGHQAGTRVRVPQGPGWRSHARLDRSPRGDRSRGESAVRAPRDPAHRGFRPPGPPFRSKRPSARSTAVPSTTSSPLVAASRCSASSTTPTYGRRQTQTTADNLDSQPPC